jgi:hypothetical protein
MTPEQLEAGRAKMYDEFYRYGSILRRSLGLPGALKRIAYNVGWQRADALWDAIVRFGLMPVARPIFERILARHTRWGFGGLAGVGRAAAAAVRRAQKSVSGGAGARTTRKPRLS